MLARYGSIALVCIAVAVMAVFGAVLFDDRRSAPPIIIEDPLIDAAIVVAVEGAVATPGVYELTGEARVQDALDAAGGARNDADLVQVNLARRLRDEERLVIPAIGDAPVVSETPAATRSTSTAAAAININTATADELDELPGIGEVLAARIVAYREEHGPFLTVEQLAAVEGISLDMVDDLRALITV